MRRVCQSSVRRHKCGVDRFERIGRSVGESCHLTKTRQHCFFETPRHARWLEKPHNNIIPGKINPTVVVHLPYHSKTTQQTNKQRPVTASVTMKLSPSSLSAILLAHCALAEDITFNVGCTICQDGSTPSGAFGDVDCLEYQSDLATIDATNPLCTEFQVQGYRNCNCPTFPSDQYCSLCNDGFYQIPNENRRVPLLEKTCSEILFTSVDSGDCDTNAAAAYYCGCPNAVKNTDCDFCSDGELIARQYRNRKVPPTFEYRCIDMEEATSLVGSADDCSNLGSSDLPVDLKAYCGCDVVTTKPTDCRLCAAGETVLEEVRPDDMAGQSCGDIATMALFVTDTEYCASSIEPLQSVCCNTTAAVVNETDVPPTASPTALPTTSPIDIILDTSVPTINPSGSVMGISSSLYLRCAALVGILSAVVG